MHSLIFINHGLVSNNNKEKYKGQTLCMYVRMCREMCGQVHTKLTIDTYGSQG